MDDILVPVSPGELIDKLTILRIKSENIHDPAKLANVHREMEQLTRVADAALPSSDELSQLWQDLYDVNCDLWQVEDDIRTFEQRRDFGAGFIGLARSVYITNDRRAELKKRINMLLGSRLVEEKSYTDHGRGE